MTIIERGVIVRGNIQAENLQIAGEVHGNVVVQGRLELLPGAKLVGDARCGLFCVHPGALFDGNRQREAPSASLPEPEPTFHGGFVGGFASRGPESKQP